MPEPVYNDVLTRASAERLAQLVRELPHPVALAGGHAVRLRVEKEWRRAFGQEYFGSRDIDLCYYVDPKWSTQELRDSAVGRAPARIREVGYKPLGMFRFGIILDAHGNVLDAEPPAPAIRMIDYDTLFLDPMVTHMHEDLPGVLGFTPVDEPLLRVAFQAPGARTPLPALGENVFLPTASLLIATKLKSLPQRTKDDKAIKDICDLYALATYGGQFMSVIRNVTHSLLDDVPALVRQATSHEFFPNAAEHLDVSTRDIEAAIRPIALPPVEPDGEPPRPRSGPGPE